MLFLAIVSPSTNIFPYIVPDTSSGITLVKILKRVVFPTPVLPVNKVTLPNGIEKFTSFKTLVFPSVY